MALSKASTPALSKASTPAASSKAGTPALSKAGTQASSKATTPTLAKAAPPGGKAYMLLKNLHGITTASEYCVRVRTEPLRQGGRESNYVLNGDLWDNTGRFDFVKWSASSDDLKIFDNKNKYYIISNFAMEKIPPLEAAWSTSPVKTKIRFTKDTKVTPIDSPPTAIPLHPMQPTVTLANLETRLNAQKISGYKTPIITGDEKQQPLFMLVDLSGTIVAVDQIKAHNDGHCYDCTLASGHFDLIVTVWTNRSAPEVANGDDVFVEKIKVTRPMDNKIIASLSLTSRTITTGQPQANKTTGKFHILTKGTLPGPHDIREHLNEPWQKMDSKELPADLINLKNLNPILDTIPNTLEEADVHIFEVRGVWITEMHGEMDKWFVVRCTKCKKTDGCPCGVEKKPGCFGILTLTDGSASIRASIGESDNGLVAKEVFVINKLDRLPAIIKNDRSSVLMKNRIIVRIRVAPYNHYTGGLKMGARIIAAKSDMYMDDTIANDFTEVLPLDVNSPTVNEIFFDDLAALASSDGHALADLDNTSCMDGVAIVTRVNECACKKNSENHLWEMTGKVAILNKTGDSNEANVYAIDAVESAIARFSLAKNKSYIIIFTKVEKEDDTLTLHVQRGMLIPDDDLKTVKGIFSVAAERDLHKKLSVPGGSTVETPTNFADWFKELDSTPRKRAATFGAPAEDVEKECAFTKLPTPKKLRTS